jgi:hypothetical protein
MFAGTIGFFFMMMFLFIRFLPAINIFEMKDLLHRLKHSGHGMKESVAVHEEGI